MNKNILSIISIVVAICSCSSMDVDSSVLAEGDSAEMNEQVYYHEVSGLYLKHQNDPFSLSNMQAAYDKIVNTKGEGGYFQQGGKLSPTHFALKMYPRTQKEWSAIDNMEDIKVSYFPFDYTPVPGEAVSENGQNIQFEEAKYTETCTYTPTDGVVEKEETVTLPVLYVVWPIEKELPKEYDYVVDYEVFIPSYAARTKSESGLSLSEKRALEREALCLALGESVLSKNRILTKFDDEGDSANFKVLTGSVFCFDSTYNANLPMPNLGMRFQLGTFIYDSSTNDIGTYDFTIDTYYHPYLNCYIHFRYSQFEVRLGNSTSYYQISLGTMTDVFGTGLYGHRDFDLSYLPTPLLRAHQAAAYYYRGSHNITKYSSSGIRVVIQAYTIFHPASDDIRGSFGFLSDIPIIEIYRNKTNRSSEYISSTLHELGHYLHYGLVGYSNFSTTQLLILESFSSFVGWSLGHQYYQKYNHYLGTGLNDETGQGRQDWTGPGSPYSPLFIDLQDSFNQAFNSGYIGVVYDTISGVPYSVIESIITTCTTWTAVRQALASLVNTYYSQNDFDALVALYPN